MCRRMQAGIDHGHPVDLHHAFRAVSVDVISDFAFDRCYDFLDKQDIGATFFEMGSRHRPGALGLPPVPLFLEPGSYNATSDGTVSIQTTRVCHGDADGVCAAH